MRATRRTNRSSLPERHDLTPNDQPVSRADDPGRQSLTVRILGSALIATIIYVAVHTVVFCVAAVSYQKGVVLDLPWLLTIQRELYMNGGWNIFQTRSDCVAFDEKLLYKPRIGSCQFDNIEFRTTVHFTPDGRLMSDVASSGKAIAVIGDSYAMGWGVNDAETFSSELQRRTGRKVYNLAVSSYGTVRETMRLSEFDHLDDVDTVIIQYCSNDIDENVRFKLRSPAEARRKFAGITEPRRTDRWFVVKYYWRCYRATLWRPFVTLWRRMRDQEGPEDFGPHYAALMNVLRNAPGLQGKRIIIFYARDYGLLFKNFPTGKDAEMANVTFVDIHLDRTDLYVLDPHWNPQGHTVVARQLAEALAVP